MAVLNTGLAKVSGEAFTIDQSLRFNDDDSPYLSRTPASAGNRKTWTYSFWVKRGNFATGRLIGAYNGATEDSFNFSSEQFKFYVAGANSYGYATDALFRDPSAWYHIIVAVDTTIASPAADRVKLYVNGVATTFGADGALAVVPEDYEFWINDDVIQGVSWDGNNSVYFDGYLAEVHFIDGTAYDADDFGETGTYGEWKPKEVSGLTYGTNGFYLKFRNEPLAFVDSSSSGRSITANGGVAHSLSQSKVPDSSSSIVFDGTDDYLTIADSADWDIGTSAFTVETWAKIATDAPDYGGIFGMHTGSDQFQCRINNEGRIQFLQDFGGTRGNTTDDDTSGTNLRDDAWHHLAFVRESDETWDLYVDGVSEYSGTGMSGSVTGITTIAIGRRASGTIYLKGYLDELRFSNTARYTSNFTAPTTAFAGDSNTLLLIHSNYTALTGLGNDSSGNDNDWTANNLTIADQMVDSPTNNFCTFNSLWKHGNAHTFSEGNLKVTTPTGDSTYVGNFGMSSGKWYWEVTIVSGVGNGFGIIGDDYTSYGAATSWCGYKPSAYVYYESAQISNDNSALVDPYGDTFAAPDILSVAYDADAGTLKFYNNGVDQGVAVSSGLTDSTYYPLFGEGSSGGSSVVHVNFGQDSSFAGVKTAQGNQDSNGIGDFYYTPPTDFLALCTANLPDVAVKPQEHFNTILYDDGAGAKTGVGFQPDLVWLKSRGSTYVYKLVDALRGVTKAMSSDSEDAESTDSTGLTAFGADGFTVGADTNYSDTTGDGMVAWCWNAGTGIASGTTSGSGTGKAYNAIYNTGVVSLINYRGNSTDGHTIPHHLGVAPDFMVVKAYSRSGVGWMTYNQGMTDLTGSPNWYGNWERAEAWHDGDADQGWSDSAPTSSVFSLGKNNNFNDDDEDYIGYCFKNVDGYSKAGVYEGNDDTDGTFVYLGFRPAWILMVNTEGANSWIVWDNKRSTYNTNDSIMEIHDTTIETVDDDKNIDMLSNGFKLRNDRTGFNGETTHMYLAFAETPFKYSNAR
jgi:hypothetical protein